MPKVPDFQIKVNHCQKLYRMDVRQTLFNEEIERYEVRAKNHTFLFDVNRPAMIAKGQKHLDWEWKHIAGQAPGYWIEDIQQEIRKTLNWRDHV